MFRKIKSFFSPPKPSKTQDSFPLPFDLSEGDYRKLLALSSSEDFLLLSETLDKAVSLYGERLLASTDTSEIHFLRGKILGIRFAMEFVDELHLKEKDFILHERRRNPSGITRERSSRATFGTPAWTPKA